MKHRQFNHGPISPSGARRGFTMVELLVVIGIIIFLVGVTVSVVKGVLTTAKEKRTKATIKKIDGLLTQRMEAFTMGLKAQKLTGPNAGTVQRKKALFKTNFPQTLAEAGLGTDSVTDATASSEALYEFLINGETFGAPAVDTDAFDSSEVTDTDGDGHPEFVDGWGRPIRFYRWPTRLIRPAPDGQETESQTLLGTSPDEYYKFPLDPEFAGLGNPGYGAEVLLGPLQPASGTSRKSIKSQPLLKDEYQDPLAKDPDDPRGALVSPRTATRVEEFEASYHTPDTWSTPLIISLGPDGVLGLFEPVDTANHGHLAQPKFAELEGLLDNITNRNLLP